MGSKSPSASLGITGFRRAFLLVSNLFKNQGFMQERGLHAIVSCSRGHSPVIWTLPMVYPPDLESSENSGFVAQP
jgi:hypothetical protein